MMNKKNELALQVLTLAVLASKGIKIARLSGNRNFDEKKAAEYEKKFREQTFSLNDYLDQFAQIRKMGSIDQLI